MLDIILSHNFVIKKLTIEGKIIRGHCAKKEGNKGNEGTAKSDKG